MRPTYLFGKRLIETPENSSTHITRPLDRVTSSPCKHPVRPLMAIFRILAPGARAGAAGCPRRLPSLAPGRRRRSPPWPVGSIEKSRDELGGPRSDPRILARGL